MLHIKKTLAFIIVLGLISTLVPALLSPVSAAGAVTRMKTLNLASQVTDTSSSAEKWSWDAASKTLSMNGITVNAASGNGIILPAGATVAVTGNNTVNAPGASCTGIESQGSLVITGSGSLSVTADHIGIFSLYSLNVQLTDLTANAQIGIWTDTDMNISPFKSSISAVLTGSLTATSVMSNKVDISTGGNINVTDNVSAWLGMSLYAAGELNFKKGSSSTVLMSSGFNSNILLAGTIPAGNTVTLEGNVQIPAGKTLVNNGAISVRDGYTLTKYGSIINNGTITPDPVRVTASVVYVNGIDILKAPGYTMPCGGGTAVFTPIDNTLTLTNAAITNGYQFTGTVTAGIYADSAISIKVIGTNTIIGTSAFGYGIYITGGGGLRSAGPGTMSAQGTKAAVYTEGTLYLSNELYAASPSANGAAIVVHRVSGYLQPFYPVVLTGSIYARGSSLISSSLEYWTYGYSVSYNEATGFRGADQYVDIRSRVTDTWFEIDFSIPTYKIGQTITPVHIYSIAGEPPYAYTASNLPEGLYVDDFGNIKGTPTKVTPSGIAVITFTDANSRSFIMNVPYGPVTDPNVSDQDNNLTLTSEAVLGEDGTAAARLTGDELSAALVSLPRTTGALKITLNVTVPDGAHNLAVTLPITMFNSISDMKPSIKIVSPLGNIYMDKYQLQTIYSQAGGADVTASIVVKTALDLNENQLRTIHDNNIDLETEHALIVEPVLKAGGISMHLTGFFGEFSIPYTFQKWQTPLLVPLDSEGGGEYIPMSSYMEKDHVVLYNPASTYLIYISPAYPYNNPYNDVYTSSWFADDVKFVTMNGLMNGTGEQSFAPFTNTTRGMMVTLLYRLEGTPTVTGKSGFTDVADNTYYTNAVTWASTKNIVNGFGGKFSPNDVLTREQMVTILYRYTRYKNYELNGSDTLSTFNDKGKINSYALPAMQWSVAKGLVSGISPNEIAPQNNAQRSQIAAVLKRYMENIQQ